MTPAHQAVEDEDLPRLREYLDGGVDVEEVDGGLTLLQHAIDVEIDGHVQTGGPLHVDVTAYLLARGADPYTSPVGGSGASALHMAQLGGHWLAVSLIEAFAQRRQ
ncbi:ankyrin repeat domain-containing protein [Micromonospora tulbaghiae]|uniref:ankyrin repeat domain-containing protein n=1 Tax=Micromonospora tulbaghiae TaxID=479978 RepID=UPI0033B0C6B1